MILINLRGKLDDHDQIYTQATTKYTDELILDGEHGTKIYGENIC